MKLEVWHNLLWSRYKGAVFSALNDLAGRRGAALSIVQIAETDRQRENLTAVEEGFHRYPYELLTKGNYHRVNKLSLYRTVAAKARRSDADVVFIPGIDRPEYWVQAIVLALRGRKRAVFCDSTAYDHSRKAVKGVAKRLFFRLVPWTLSYGERARAYVMSYGVRPDHALQRVQASALPAGYDASLIPALRKEHQHGAPRFLYVGRLSGEKSLDVLIRAFALFQGRTPDATLRLVGTGPAEAALRALTQELGLGETVVFSGSANSKALEAEYLAATALVLPSRSEPWGIVVNEALHYGCPVIVSHRCGCVPELVENSDCGIVVPWGDVEALAAALDQATAWTSDVEGIAAKCLAKIAPYNPTAAATQILDAAERILAA